ncbi:MAG: hypothetical protein KBT01_00655 [Clostridiales bacterium]|nr:hypothetical protein [Candidatus Blautia equi]
MCQLSADFSAYYDELEYEERKEIFERLLKEVPDDGFHAFRREVHEMRYPKPKRAGSPQIDRFLMNIVYFPGLYMKKISLFSRPDREIKRICKELGLDRADSYSEEQKEILYGEFYNAAALYFDTCRDAGYGRKLFGMVMPGAGDKNMQICSEAWIASTGIPMMGGVEKEMAVFSEAVKNAYFAFDRKAERLFNEYDAQQKQRMNGKRG